MPTSLPISLSYSAPNLTENGSPIGLRSSWLANSGFSAFGTYIPLSFSVLRYIYFLSYLIFLFFLFFFAKGRRRFHETNQENCCWASLRPSQVNERGSRWRYQSGCRWPGKSWSLAHPFGLIFKWKAQEQILSTFMHFWKTSICSYLKTKLRRWWL